ncbi:HAD family hydrolase [Streptomyces sp. NPDC048594]|uniref:HAD family hydrolase n=1 Tax=Streptomyces sp. NPDC048594 TaxID=3365575 RepID=UPI003711286E
MKVTGIICDVGGTLLLTDELHREAWRRALELHGLATDDNLSRARSGLAKGLDSFATAESVTAEAGQARLLALAKQRYAQVPTPSAANPATMEWLRGRKSAVLAAVTHSDEAWTRTMLQLAGVLDHFVFVRGRTDRRRVTKQALLADADALLRTWWGADDVVYCGDTEHDREVAARLALPYVDAASL